MSGIRASARAGTRAAVLGAALIGVAVLGGGLLAPATAAQASTRLAAPTATGDQKCEAGTQLKSPLSPPALAQLQTDLAWPITTGAGVLVAVVDSGVDAANPHLADAIAGGIDMVGDGEGANGLADPLGHGTAIAGEIAARRIDGSGVVGLAPDARILSVRVFRGDDDQSIKDGFGPDPIKLAAGIRYAVDAGAQIINVSSSDPADTAELRDAAAYATEHGALVVASVGNRNTTDAKTDSDRYPAGYAGVLGVAAANPAGTVTSASIHGPQVAVSAPGNDVLSAFSGGADCQFAPTANSEPASTSYATGYASGAAALVADAHPDETPAQWAYRLEATAVRADPDRRTDTAGWGLIQPYDAITLSPGPGIRGPESPFADTAGSAIVTSQRVVTPDHSASPFDLTRDTALLVGVIGATLLGTIGVLTVLLRRRRDARAAARR